MTPHVCQLSSTVEPCGPEVVVRLAGQLCERTLPALSSLLASLAHDRHDIAVDASRARVSPEVRAAFEAAPGSAHYRGEAEVLIPVRSGRELSLE